jgi:hypothetical protein
MTEKRNQRELLWFQTGGALNFITAAPHCGVSIVGHFKMATELKIKVHTIFFPVVFLESTVH